MPYELGPSRPRAPPPARTGGASPRAGSRRAPAAAQRRRRLRGALPARDRYAQGVRRVGRPGARAARGADLRARPADRTRDRDARAGRPPPRRQSGLGRAPRLHPGRCDLSLGARRLPGRGQQQVRGDLLHRPGSRPHGEPAPALGGGPPRLPRGGPRQHRLRRQPREPDGDHHRPRRPPPAERGRPRGRRLPHLAGPPLHREGAPHRGARRGAGAPHGDRRALPHAPRSPGSGDRRRPRRRAHAPG